MPPSKAKQAEVAERRTELVKLRRQGVQFDDPRIIALGYATPGAASKDMIRLLEQRRDEQEAEVSVYRQEEKERLDSLLAAVWQQAEDGDLRAIETALKIADRRAKLLGLDAPTKAEVSGPDGGAIPLGSSLAELNSLIATAGELGPASDFALPTEAEDDNGDG